MNLFKNPLVRIVGIIIVLYFALFANKNNPQSLGNRFSAEKIKQNLGEMEEKGKFIVSNVKAAKSYEKIRSENIKNGEFSDQKIEVQLKDIAAGFGEKKALCGSKVKVLYILNSEKAINLLTKPEEDFLIGEKKNWLIEKNIMGMKKGGVREIKVPQGFITEDKELEKFLKTLNSDLTYQLVLKEIVEEPNPKSNLNCQE